MDDPRKLAEEALRLAEAATPGPWFTAYAPGDVRKASTAGWPSGVVICAVAPRQRVYADPPGGSYPAADERLIAHAGTHYATLARALVAALDERDSWRVEATKRADERHAATCERLEMEKTMLRARADRDALLADLPHAVGRCDCPPAKGARTLWPEAHTAAIKRLEGRIK